MKKLSQEAWKQAEENLNQAEVVQRKERLLTNEIFDETGIPQEERKLEDDEKAIALAVEALLGAENSPERALLSLRRQDLWKALRAENQIIRKKNKKFFIDEAKDNKENEAVDRELQKLLQKEIEEYNENYKRYPGLIDLQVFLEDKLDKYKKEHGKTAPRLQGRLGEVKKRIKTLDQEYQDLLVSSPEAYYGLRLKELKEYKRASKESRIVETNYVKEITKDIIAHLDLQKPVLIYGHLGCGKTELAMHIAKNYLGKEALVISGSKYTSTAEFYGHQVLSIREINDNRVKEVKEEVEIEFNKWVEENPQATEDDKNRAHDRILTLYNSKLQAGSTFSEFFLGPVYRAMQEGRPVIIDEINAIPHEILISLNNLLTRKVGDKVNIQQNTGTEIQVKDGFCVMATGNLNQGQEKYVGRQDMDPAFLSRFYLQKYDYLPQTKEGTLENEASGDNDLFKLILAKLMDRNGQIEIPQDSIKKLWKLAQAARLTQDVFSGKEVTSAYYYREAGGRPVQYFLKESVMSIRAIENILDQWQKDDYDKELDYYLWKEFISQSTMASDRAYLYQIFQRQFGFFDGSSGGWEQNPDYGSAGVISSFDIKAPENPSEDKKFFGPRDVVEFAFGKAPERLNWPDIDVKQGETTEQNLEELQELESWANSFDGVLSEIETAINEECQLQ